MRQIRTNLHNDKCVAGQMPTQTNMYNDTKTQILVYLDIWLLTSVASSISVFFIQLVKEYCIVVQTLKCNFVLYSFSCSLKTVYANSICPRDTARWNKTSPSSDTEAVTMYKLKGQSLNMRPGQGFK